MQIICESAYENCTADTSPLLNHHIPVAHQPTLTQQSPSDATRSRPQSPATEYYQEMTTTEMKTTCLRQRNKRSRPTTLRHWQRLPVGSLPAQTLSKPGNIIKTTSAGGCSGGERQACLVAEILREQQLDRLKNIADHRLKLKNTVNHPEALGHHLGCLHTVDLARLQQSGRIQSPSRPWAPQPAT
ncbi:hypothetical protein PSTT_03271 [Puccinia striiformis]|uniref:Uncharacterized protein n=1 Tax=Puccinia striiformis TaxID=27350 RepID=A0A2S4VWQ3_9BASI|nr:hypothetical protein PSTT_03271 [Puccinia striiformis]